MDVITHKCPNCDGALTFDPSDQKFHCPYCGSVFTEEEVSLYEANQKEARMSSDAPTDNQPEETARSELSDEDDDVGEMDLFTCPSCGAEIVTDATTAATYCYFCHNPVVLTGRLSGKFLPNKVLPFSIEKEAATKQFLEWVQKKWFVPKDFFDEAQIEKLTGVYFPYWVVEADADAEISGTGTSIRVWRVGDVEYTETKTYDVLRGGTMKFRNLVKNALSKNTQQKMVESVQPFPLGKAVPFKNQYLAGFQAEKRDIEYQKIQKNVQSEISNYGEIMLRNSINGYTSFNRKLRHVNITNEDNQYMLLPVWLVTYRNNEQSDKVFYYAMNGQTGKVSGILPISYKKLGLATGGIFAILTLLFMIVGYLI